MPNTKKRAQSINEFSILLLVIVGAIVGMKLYVQRALQARYKDGVCFAISKVRENVPADYVYTQFDPSNSQNTSTTTEHRDYNIMQGYPKSTAEEHTYVLPGEGYQKTVE